MPALSKRRQIDLVHTMGRQKIRAGSYVTVQASGLVEAEGPVSCGIPGHDHPGQELWTSVQHVDDEPLRWELSGRCGFASDFDYRADS